MTDVKDQEQSSLRLAQKTIASLSLDWLPYYIHARLRSSINIHLAWYNIIFLGMQFILMQHTLCCLEKYYVTSSVMSFIFFYPFCTISVQYSSAEITLRLFVEAEYARIATALLYRVYAYVHVPAVI